MDGHDPRSTGLTRNAANPPSPLGLGPAIKNAMQPLPPISSDRQTAGTANTAVKEALPIAGAGNAANGHTLTELEYRQFRKMLDAGGATAGQVALVNAAVKGTSLLIVAVFWILALVAFRYIFNRWFDEDVYTETWPSVAVITAMIFATAYILGVAVG